MLAFAVAPEVPPLDPIVFVLIATSAVFHVTWNVLLKTSADPLRAATVMMSVGAVVLVPSAAVGWLVIGRPAIPPEAIWLGILSGALEVVYFTFLSAAYRRGDLSIVYPLARGSATLLAVGIGVVLLGERLGPPGQLGLGILLAGFLWLQRPWQILGAALRRNLEGGVAFAIATGMVIALYSAVDRVGAQLTQPWLYAAVIWISASGGLLVLAAVLGARRRAPATGPGAWSSTAASDAVGPAAAATGPAVRDRLAGVASRAGVDRRLVAGGVIGVVQYLLILAALSIAPLSAVAPLRESAVILGTGWGAFRLGEAAHRGEGVARVAAAALIVAGAILLGLDK